MGISDDIKPKNAPKPKSVEEFNDPKLGDSDGQLANENNTDENDATEIKIDKSGINKPVFDDLYPPLPEQDIERDNKISKKENRTEAAQDIVKHQPHKAFHDHYHAPENQHKKPLLLIFIISVFVLALIAVLIWQNIDQIKTTLHINSNDSSSTNDQTPSSSGVEIVPGQDYTSTNDSAVPATDSSTPDSSSTPSASNSNATPSPSALSGLKVSVLNGNGISGSAATVKDTLVAAGYTIDRVANASNFAYQSTTIYYATGKKPEADALAQVLSSRTVVLYLNNAVVGSRDIVVVVGKK